MKAKTEKAEKLSQNNAGAPKKAAIKAKWPRLQRWLWVVITLNLLLVMVFWARFLLKRVDQGSSVEEETLTVKTTYESPQKGEKAPEFTVKSLQGESISLVDFRDKEPVVVILFSTWHPFCQDALSVLAELAKQDVPWAWLPVAVQEKRSVVVDFLSRGDYQFEVYLDEGGQVGEKFQVTTLPAYYFIDRNGVFVDVYLGPLSGEEIVEKGRKL